MNANEPKSEWIRLVATPTDKALLEAITNQIAREDGDANMSATVRRLIWQEAKRRGIEVSISDIGATV